MPATPASCPFPRWIAHRGAGRLAPENTLAAFAEGARRGHRMVECDVQLSADGVAFLLHDATLDRTTDGHGPATVRPWAELAALDAGAWHSPAHRGERLPTLAQAARWSLSAGVRLNLEIKPPVGQGDATGRTVAQQARQLWADHREAWPLLTSFDPQALAGAQAVAPALPRGLLVDPWWPGVWDTLSALEACALVAEASLWTAGRVQQTHALGWHALAYTVNDAARAQALRRWGVDSLITDRVDRFRP